jgi:hypothetical protein
MADITFTITDLAREFGLTTRAIRFYEETRACCTRGGLAEAVFIPIGIACA